MPRVSDEHLERRRRQILDAARRCFGRKGFHQTSMQDVFRESGLSAGAVYRYFKSKNEIVQAIAKESQSAVAGLLDDILRRDPLPPLAEMIGLVCERIVALLGPTEVLRIVPQVWAEASNDPEIHPIPVQILTGTRAAWARIAERMRDDGDLPPDTDPEAVGATLMCLVPGFILQYLMLGDISGDTLRTGMRAITSSSPTRATSGT